ncbi:MAG: hypothetical protein ACRD63_04680 [Pyrinomonadaceae bacterium]
MQEALKSGVDYLPEAVRTPTGKDGGALEPRFMFATKAKMQKRTVY